MSRRALLAAALGLVAVAAVVTGTLLLVPSPSPQQPPSPRQASLSLESSSRETGRADDGVPSVATKPRSVPDRGAAQSPGTVRLPEGGTANLVRRELTTDGTLPIPERLDQATWWGAQLGAVRGVALLSGHVDWQGRTGPFDELWRDRAGQRVTVVDRQGGHWVYRITDALTLHKDALPAQAQRLFDQTGPHRLVLVTCGGDYVGGTDGYRDNRIVTAELVTRP